MPSKTSGAGRTADLLGSKWVRWALAPLLAVAVYGLLGTWLAPVFLLRHAESAIAGRTGGRLEVDAVSVNPFTLTATVENATLLEGGGRPLAAVARVRADLSAATLLERRWLFRDVQVDGLALALPSTAGEAGPLGWLADVLSRAEAALEAANQAEVALGQLTIRAGSPRPPPRIPS